MNINITLLTYNFFGALAALVFFNFCEVFWLCARAPGPEPGFANYKLNITPTSLKINSQLQYQISNNLLSIAFLFEASPADSTSYNITKLAI